MEISQENMEKDNFSGNLKNYYKASEPLNVEKIINVIKVLELQGFEIDRVIYSGNYEDTYNGLEYSKDTRESDLKDYSTSKELENIEEVTAIIHNNDFDGQAYFTVGFRKFQICFQPKLKKKDVTINFGSGR